MHTAPVAAKGAGRRAAGAGKQASDSSSSGARRQRLLLQVRLCRTTASRQCKSKKELRSCLACHEQGHLVATCPRVRRAAAARRVHRGQKTSKPGGGGGRSQEGRTPADTPTEGQQQQ